MMVKPSSCALCVKRPPVVRRPLGSGGASVWICAVCDGEAPPRVRLGPERGYQVPESSPDAGSGSLRARFSAGAARVVPATPSRGRYSGRPVSPGFVLVRVPCVADGRRIDREEALQRLADKPWHADLRHLGSDARFHLFERPDAEAARAARQQSNYDAAEALARMSRGSRSSREEDDE